MSWNLSCPDWVERLKSGRSLVPDLPLNRAVGDNAVKVFNKLRLADVPGTPTMEEAGGDWFRDIVRALFGSYDPVVKARMIRELMVLVPKKNSKTTNGALLMLTALLLNERPRAPFMVTAPVQDVAEVAFNAVAGAIELDGVLSKILHVRNHLKTIVHRESKAELKIMTFDPAALTGPKYVGALVDELHVSAKNAKAASAIRQIRGGMVPFPEAFLAFITTQSEEAPAGVFRAELIKAREIRDGKRQGAMLPVLYEFPPEMQTAKSKPWRDPALWRMVTPNLGRSVDLERLKQEFTSAEDTSEAELRAWASQHLNVEIGLALHSDGWAGAPYWEEQDASVTLKDLLERCEVATVGVDGGGLDDLLAIAVIGRDRKTGEWLHWARAWAHEKVLELRKEAAPRLLDFAADGDLVLVEKIGDDVRELVDVIEQLHDAGILDHIGVDPAGIGSVVEEIVAREMNRMQKEGPEGQLTQVDRVIGVSQGWKLNGAIKTTERKLAEGGLLHGGTRLMSWCVGNAKVEPRGNAILITKQASGTGKIDPLMATFNAVTLMSLNPAAPQTEFQFFAL